MFSGIFAVFNVFSILFKKEMNLDQVVSILFFFPQFFEKGDLQTVALMFSLGGGFSLPSGFVYDALGVRLTLAIGSWIFHSVF